MYQKSRVFRLPSNKQHTAFLNAILMKRNKATFGIRDELGEYKTRRRSTRRRLIFDSFQSEKMKKTPNNRKSKVVGEGRDRPEMPVTHIMSPGNAGQLKHQSFPPVHSRLVTPNEKERIISSKLKKTKATSVSKNNRPAENAVTPSPLKVDRSNKVKFVLDGHGRFPEELYITDKDGKDLALAGDQNYILHVASFFGIKELLDQFLPNQMGNLLSRNTAGQNPIHMATIGGSLYAVKYLINQLPRETHTKYCETIDEDGRTPFLLSALHGHHHVLDYLLTTGVSERHKDNAGKTAFLLAAEGGHIVSMRRIMQSVVFHQDKKENLSQALMITVSNNNQRATEFLLEAGATNENALVMAVKQNLPEMVGLLIDFGADVNSDIDGGLSPIWMSLHKENYKMSLLLLQRGATVSESTLPFGCSIMHYVVKSQCVNLLTDCIAAGAILDLPDDQNRTPLELFSSRPWKKDFLEAYEPHWTLKGINRRNSLGKTPLHIAASVGNPVLVACLLRRGANVTAEDNQKNQPIHDAVVAKDISYFHDTSILSPEKNVLFNILSALKEGGCDINATNMEQKTPFMLACQHGRYDWCHNLIRNGCRVTGAAGSPRSSPIFLLTKHRQISLLRDALNWEGYGRKSRRFSSMQQEELDEALEWAITRLIDPFHFVNVLLQSGALLQPQALHRVIDWRSDGQDAIDVINCIFSSLVLPDIDELHEGKTPLFRAIECCKSNIAICLLKNHADPKIVCGHEKLTPLDLAGRHRLSKVLQVMKLK